jgi:hypothetical protein
VKRDEREKVVYGGGETGRGADEEAGGGEGVGDVSPLVSASSVAPWTAELIYPALPLPSTPLPVDGALLHCAVH